MKIALIIIAVITFVIVVIPTALTFIIYMKAKLSVDKTVKEFRKNNPDMNAEAARLFLQGQLIFTVPAEQRTVLDKFIENSVRRAYSR